MFMDVDFNRIVMALVFLNKTRSASAIIVNAFGEWLVSLILWWQPCTMVASNFAGVDSLILNVFLLKNTTRAPGLLQSSVFLY